MHHPPLIVDDNITVAALHVRSIHMPLPWIAQDLLGIPSAEDFPNKDRVTNPTAATPATFKLNWGYKENGPTQPTPKENVCTFMGAPTSILSGVGREYPDENVYLVKAALDIMRKHGYRCELPPNSWKSDMLEEENSKESRELKYLEDNYYKSHNVLGKKSDGIIFVVTVICGWIYIWCTGTEGEEFVTEHLSNSPHYALAKVPHEEVSEIDNALTMTRRTGGAPNGKAGSISTVFELKKYNKIIAKARCTYYNGEMDNSGPTIEPFEVAKEWRQHGYGKLLLVFLAKYFVYLFEDMFMSDEENQFEINSNVCYCTSRYACQWFLRQGFEDWDGMGEELGQHLFYFL